MIRVYSLPDGTFSSDEEEEDDDDEEEEEEDEGGNFVCGVQRRLIKEMRFADRLVVIQS